MTREESVLRVVDFEPLVTETDGYEMGAINCLLENGDVLTLYNVPIEITKAIAKLIKDDDNVLEVEEEDSRDTIYELLIMIHPKLEAFKKSLNQVVIDSFNRTFGTYSASLYMNVDGIYLKRTMIPSHAIFLALLFGKPVYVTEEVVRISKELEEGPEDSEDDDFELFMDDEDDNEF